MEYIHLRTIDSGSEKAREITIPHDQTLRMTGDCNPTICTSSIAINPWLPHCKLDQDAGLLQFMKGNKLKYLIHAPGGLVICILDMEHISIFRFRVVFRFIVWRPDDNREASYDISTLPATVEDEAGYEFFPQQRPCIWKAAFLSSLGYCPGDWYLYSGQ